MQRRHLLKGVIVGLLVCMFIGTPAAQGSFSAQIQAALQLFVQQPHTWTQTQTFQNIVINGTCTGSGCGGGSTPGGADTSVQFNDGGSFGGFGSWDGSVLTIPTIGDGDTNNLTLNLRVHEGGANEAAFTLMVDGSSGDNTPFTLITFPGAAVFDTNGAIAYESNGTFYFNGISAVDGANFQLQTFLDAQVGPVGFTLSVHHDEVNAADFSLLVDGNSGNNTPVTTMTAPGNVAFVLPIGGGVLLGESYHELTEMTAPAAGASDTVRIYAEDTGAGKTRLCALFSSGAAQCFATQP